MSSTKTDTPTSQIPNWNMKVDYVETCNCDYGCPCNISGFPTYGNCQALLLFHIRSARLEETITIKKKESSFEVIDVMVPVHGCWSRYMLRFDHR
jgi:hypothetical protein